MPTLDRQRVPSFGVLSISAAVAYLLAVGVVTAVQAQTAPSGSGGSGPAAGPNCAVTTARIGSTDVTEFFGLTGGPATFNQSFGLPSSADSATDASGGGVGLAQVAHDVRPAASAAHAAAPQPR